MKRVKLSLGDRSYDILIGNGLISNAGAILKRLRLDRHAVVVTNKRIARLYANSLQRSLKRAGIESRIELVPDSEKAKSSNILTRLLDRIGRYGKNRPISIIALGGGVIGDLAGFAASIYKRGVPYVQIPTTLLAQVDSAIGGKVAIDLILAKNLVGSFYQPKAVISDTSVLSSLSKRQIRNGMAECIKYGVIKDKALFEYLERNYKKIVAADKKALEYVILSASRIKAGVVEKDELDRTGKRAILNFGHTIGHAIEAASSYSNRYNHGEAVAIGMAIAARISFKLQLLKRSDLDRIESLIKNTGLPVKFKGLKASAIYDKHLHDKKFIHGNNRFVLLVSIGKVRIVEGVPQQVILSSIKECLE